LFHTIITKLVLLIVKQCRLVKQERQCRLVKQERHREARSDLKFWVSSVETSRLPHYARSDEKFN